MNNHTLPSAKLIFVVGSCTNRGPHTLQRGDHFTRGLLQHNLRISTRRCWSYIDPDRSHLNLVRCSGSTSWQSVSNDQERQMIFKVLSDHFQQVIARFKAELKSRNDHLKLKKRYRLIKTGSQYVSSKNVTGEGIISVSRAGFVMNELIRTQTDRKFRVLNQPKLLVGAGHVHDGVQNQIKYLFHPDAFLASFLHLDESNVHIHCQHVQFMYKFDGRQQKMVHTFTRPKQMTPIYLSELRRALYEYLRIKLQADRFPGAPMTPSYDPKAGLDLYQYKINDLKTKIAKLQQQVKAHQLQSQLQIDLINHRFNQDLLRMIRSLDRSIIEQIYTNLVRAGYKPFFLQQHLFLTNNSPIQPFKTMERTRQVNSEVIRNLAAKIC